MNMFVSNEDLENTDWVYCENVLKRAREAVRTKPYCWVELVVR